MEFLRPLLCELYKSEKTEKATTLVNEIHSLKINYFNHGVILIQSPKGSKEFHFLEFRLPRE